ncbi:MAG: hypothetical protein V4690_00590 [Patescibacteria group bacterium]
MQIHVDQRLIRGSILVFSHFSISDRAKEEFEKEAINTDGLINFSQAISALDGMEERISYNRYQIQMLKSPMFSWEILVPQILDALRTFVAKDSQIEEAAEAKRPTPEYLEALRKEGCEV